MIDIGVNLTNSRFDKDRELVIDRAQQALVEAMLVTGTNVQESQKACQLAQTYPDYLYCTAGVHPHDADNAEADYLLQIEKLALQAQVKAIGECGLDFNRNFSTPENQISVFKQQLTLAEKLEMPVFLHQRDAFETWFECLKPYLDKLPAIISHCFTGTEKELAQCIEAGLYIGITGWVCDDKRGQELQNIVANIPLDKLLIETDAPYLTPKSIRPKPKSSRNEPAYLPFVAQKIAECYQVDVDTIVSHSSMNAKRAFGLS